ncbi:MAG: hypothetical protein AVDCRST_MAG66-4802, partial [uncultured Pseudonocardia sp.]
GAHVTRAGHPLRRGPRGRAVGPVGLARELPPGQGHRRLVHRLRPAHHAHRQPPGPHRGPLADRQRRAPGVRAGPAVGPAAQGLAPV